MHPDRLPTAPATAARGLCWPWTAALALCLLAAPLSAQAVSDKECQRPLPPEVPQAESASDVEMISARVRINMYVEAANTYMSCLDEAEQTIGETGREVKQRRIDKKREEIQTEMVKIAEDYNAQVGIYRERAAREEAASAPDQQADAKPPVSGPASGQPATRNSPKPDPQTRSKAPRGAP